MDILCSGRNGYIRFCIFRVLSYPKDGGNKSLINNQISKKLLGSALKKTVIFTVTAEQNSNSN